MAQARVQVMDLRPSSLTSTSKREALTKRGGRTHAASSFVLARWPTPQSGPSPHPRLHPGHAERSAVHLVGLSGASSTRRRSNAGRSEKGSRRQRRFRFPFSRPRFDLITKFVKADGRRAAKNVVPRTTQSAEVRALGSMRFRRELFSKARHFFMIQVPDCDSIGEQTGFTRARCLSWIHSLICSTHPVAKREPG